MAIYLIQQREKDSQRRVVTLANCIPAMIPTLMILHLILHGAGFKL
jgi:hypothetical protein